MTRDVQESQPIPAPDDLEDVKVRTVNGAPALVFIVRGTAPVVVPLSMKTIEKAAA